jgi:hypothetical protein
MMQAHPAPARRYACPGCATCRSARRDRMIATLIIVVFVGLFVIPAAFRMAHG